MYSPEMTKPMELELTTRGIKALHTTEEVDEALQKEGTTMVVVNSVCGCAAGNARPGALFSLQHSKTPDNSYTVFAGVDSDAVKKAREYFTGKLPSSPSIALLKNKELVFMLERKDIEGHSPDEVSNSLKRAFDEYC